ncbi:MAG: permease-like cell division protein FtsX [Xanthomonadales bacterium]|nr:permease-like cell division protein FtsX [Xanthomonadales bacterium]
MSAVEKLAQRGRAVARRHSYSFFSSLGALLEHRVGTLMTVLVLGIAMLLPLGLHLTLANLDRLELQEEQWSALSVFTRDGTSEAEVRALADELDGLETVLSVEVISPEQGLAEFREAAGFASLDLLENNPLPWVLSVQPTPGEGLEGRVEALSTALEGRDVVEEVAYDQKWLERLGRLLALGQAAVNILTLLFGVAVIVVVANTIRMDVAARADEIEVLSLVGAWPAFIRQPFLYSGFWYGLLGGIMAMILVNLGLEYLEGPVGRFLASYGQETTLVGLGLVQTLALLLAGALLGLLGAWVAVQRYLRELRQSGTLGRR